MLVVMTSSAALEWVLYLQIAYNRLARTKVLL
jgi:hypothetical protein